MKKMKKTMIKKITKAFLMVALIILLGLTAYSYNRPIKSFSLENQVNLEYQANAFGLIITVKGLDQKSQNFLTPAIKKRILNKTIAGSINQTINEMKKEKILDQANIGALIITVSGQDNIKDMLLASDLSWLLKEKAQRSGWQKEDIKAFALSKDLIAEAKKENQPPGQYYLTQRLASLKILPLENYKDLSIQELLDLLDSLKAQTQELKTETAKLEATAVETTNYNPAITQTSIAYSTSQPVVQETITVPAQASPGNGLDGVTSATPKK